MEKKSLIVYYSYTGNTKKIAEEIQRETGADIVRIDTVIPYSSNYDVVVTQGQEEVNSNYKPEIKEIDINIEDYDTIILGTPVWWYTFAPAINTFLSKYNMDNKEIVPFVTNGGWLGHTIKDIKEMCPNAKVENEINIEFSGSDLSTSKDKINIWINSLI